MRPSKPTLLTSRHRSLLNRKAARLPSKRGILIALGSAFTLVVAAWPLLCTADVATPVREEALTNPSKHAWDLFLALNHPAKDPKTGRGIPDPTKKPGDPGLTVWETWKLARTEVFLEDGRKPDPWDGGGGPPTFKSLDVPKAALIRALSKGINLERAHGLSKENIRSFLVDPDDGVFQVGGGETRMNRSTFEFIVENELYNVEGQEKLYTDIVDGKKPALSFPLDSIEAKAMWIPLDESDTSKVARYHTARDQEGKLYGLVTLHVVTKDVPNWFWCSFRQRDGYPPDVPSVDTYGRPKSLDGTKWENYELSGTQTDFVDAQGRTTLLSDPYIEAGFQRSSCISCHALASIGAPSKLPNGDRLRFAFRQRTNPEVPLTPIGPPDASKFFDEQGRQKYVQLDFLFSMHFRARRKK